MSSVDGSKLGVASGTLSTMRAAGQSVGLAMATAVIATTIPPQLMLQLFTGLTTQSAIAGGDFIIGMSKVFLIASGISAVGTVASLVRGHELSEGNLEARHHVASTET
jgi:hypothetical protein